MISSNITQSNIATIQHFITIAINSALVLLSCWWYWAEGYVLTYVLYSVHYSIKPGLGIPNIGGGKGGINGGNP